MTRTVESRVCLRKRARNRWSRPSSMTNQLLIPMQTPREKGSAWARLNSRLFFIFQIIFPMVITKNGNSWRPRFQTSPIRGPEPCSPYDRHCRFPIMENIWHYLLETGRCRTNCPIKPLGTIHWYLTQPDDRSRKLIILQALLWRVIGQPLPR